MPRLLCARRFWTGFGTARFWRRARRFWRTSSAVGPHASGFRGGLSELPCADRELPYTRASSGQTPKLFRHVSTISDQTSADPRKCARLHLAIATHRFLSKEFSSRLVGKWGRAVCPSQGMSGVQSFFASPHPRRTVPGSVGRSVGWPPNAKILAIRPQMRKHFTRASAAGWQRP